MKYNFKEAFIQDDDKFIIDYSKIVISVGKREPAWSARLSFEENGILGISWEIPETVKLSIVGRDRPNILIYNTDDNEVIDPLGPERSALSMVYRLTMSYIGNLLHVWIFFVSEDGKFVSNSDYIGSGRLPEHGKDEV